jgi:two-component system NarL family response regulator
VTISVLLVEDHRLVREALRDVLAREPDIKVVAEADDAATAFECARSLIPDAVVLDDTLPDMNGIEAAAKLKGHAGVDSKIVALSVHADRHFVTEMLRAGVTAYVTKSSAAAELVRAIRAAAAGQEYICPEVAGVLTSIVRSDDRKKGKPRLSRRECEVLRLIAEGMRSPAIADRLRISIGTVEVHRRNIMRKLGLRTVADLTRYAIREGLVTA